MHSYFIRFSSSLTHCARLEAFDYIITQFFDIFVRGVSIRIKHWVVAIGEKLVVRIADC